MATPSVVISIDAGLPEHPSFRVLQLSQLGGCLVFSICKTVVRCANSGSRRKGTSSSAVARLFGSEVRSRSCWYAVEPGRLDNDKGACRGIDPMRITGVQRCLSDVGLQLIDRF